MSFQNIRLYRIEPSPYGAWGDTFRISAIVEHQGPETVAIFRAAIGIQLNGEFGELISGEQEFTFPAYYGAAGIGAEPGWVAYSPWCDVPIGTTIPIGTYDVLVSINGVSAVSLHSAVIIGHPGLEFKDFHIDLPETLGATAHTMVSVPISFSYQADDDVMVELKTYVYGRRNGEIVPLLVSSKTISLPEALDWSDWEGVGEVEIIPASEGGIGNGVYGLGSMIEGYSDQAQHNIDDCIVVSDISPPLTDMIAPLVTLVFVGGIMGMTLKTLN